MQQLLRLRPQAYRLIYLQTKQNDHGQNLLYMDSTIQGMEAYGFGKQYVSWTKVIFKDHLTTVSKNGLLWAEDVVKGVVFLQGHSPNPWSSWE